MTRPIPLGLTCAVCRAPFLGKLARRTPAGWIHARACVSKTDIEGAGRWVMVRGVSRWVLAP